MASIRRVGWRLVIPSLFFANLALAQVAIPPVARVTDLTGTLEPAQKAALEQKLAELETGKGSQIAVLIVPTTQPETIEQYSLRVAESWKLGRKGVDDGVLLVIAKGDRKLRIEVGYGLEGAIPDAIAKRVIAETITPHFRDGNIYGGVDAGVTQLIGLVNGEALPAPEPRRKHPVEPSPRSEPDTPPWAYAPMAFFVLLPIVARPLGRAIGVLRSAVICGGIYGGLLWFMTGILSVAESAGGFMLAFSLLMQVKLSWSVGWMTGGYPVSGRFSSGEGASSRSDSWSSSSSSRSSSSSGSSGGGGSFGGGGASGSW